MKQTTILGLLAAPEHLPEAQEGLHYAREVVCLYADTDEPLPAVGRGRASAGKGNGGRGIGRVVVMWGTDAALAREIPKAPRPVLVALVTSKATAKTTKVLRELEASGTEVHLLTGELEGAVRVLSTDAARCTVQVCRGGTWVPVQTALEPEATQDKGKAPKPAQEPPSAPQEPTAATDAGE